MKALPSVKSPGIPREILPQAECLLSFTDVQLWQRTRSLFILFSKSLLLFSLLFAPRLCLMPSPVISSSASMLFQLFPYVRLHSRFRVITFSVFPPSSRICYISSQFWPTHPIVWKPAHPGPAPGALRTALWVMGIVCSH